MKKNKNKIIISAISIFLIFAIIIGFISTKKKKMTVELYTVKEQDPISFSGVAKAAKNQEIYYDSTKGSIKEYYVKDGDSVIVGQKLFMYENETVKEQLNKLNRSYNNAVSNYNDSIDETNKVKSQIKDMDRKIRELSYEIENYKPLSINPENIADANLENLNNLQMALEQAKAGKNELEMTVSQMQKATKEAKNGIDEMSAEINSVKKSMTSIEKAEISGKIKLNKEAAKPSLNMSGSEALINIISEDIVVEGQVSEYDYEKIVLDKRVRLEINNSGEKMEGTIIKLDSMPNSSNLGAIPQQTESSVSNYNFLVKPDDYIHYGFSVDIKLPQEGIYIPMEAVEKLDDKFYVYEVEDDKLVKKEINVEEDDGVYKLISGLEIGEKIVSNKEGLKEGLEVNIIDNTESKDETTKKEDI
ncbi:MAG: efflux RND transporter periplasmic adaptor subunit [Tissierellia bacterium]|nr:efflux RND transporter periplasmic adaptor subunit [Tissierellia bacterium]